MNDERIVKITERQSVELRKDSLSRRIVSDVLVQMVKELALSEAEREVDYWDTVYRLAGADKATEFVSVDYVSNEILVKPRTKTGDK